MSFIRKISVKGFESHEDTVLDDLSLGLNAIVGVSNSGKSAIVRALKLVAYNEFDPQSLRKGCDNCEVQVWTDNGNVKVIRGKKNLWEVTDKTGNTSYFDKIGKQILPQVTEILGFGMVKLGDIEMQANVMDQLESHFMLAEFSGQDATGSLRAQVVDEISGLSGIETLIRDVSLDNSRLTREINQIEERNKEIAGQLHDPVVLGKEDATLKLAAEAMQQHDENREAVILFTETLAKHGKESGDVDRLELELAGFPDEAHAMAVLLSAENFVADASTMSKTFEEWLRLTKTVSDMKAELARQPDEKKALDLAKRADNAIVRFRPMSSVHEEWHRVSKIAADMAAELFRQPDDAKVLVLTKKADNAIAKAKLMAELVARGVSDRTRIGELSDELRKTPDVTKVRKLADECDSRIKRADSASEFLDTWLEVNTTVAEAADFLQRTEDEHRKAVEECNEALAGVDVCPVTMKPISSECLKDARTQEET
jgi:exonuclease SbcC